MLSDKTQGFHDQIEQKQRDLQPWTAKRSKKQAEIDIKTSERDSLVKRAEAVQEAGKEAKENLAKFRAEQESKVRGPSRSGEIARRADFAL